MNVLIIDDEQLAIDRIISLLREYESINVLATLRNSEQLLEIIEYKNIDIVFMDINMPEVDGLTLGRKIKEKYSNVKIIFITGYDSFALEAFEVEALDYLVKPIRRERFDKTVKRLLKGSMVKQDSKQLRIKTYKKFECFISTGDEDWKSMKWRTKKVKELMAYLVDHHNQKILRDTLIDMLWDGFNFQKANNNLNTTLYYLRKELNIKDLGKYIETDKETVMFKLEEEIMEVDFIYYDQWMKGQVSESIDKKLVKIYEGEYMAVEGYPWSMTKRSIYHRQYKKVVSRWLNNSEVGEVDIDRLIKMIEILPDYEECYYALIRILKKDDNKQLARNYYSKLVTLMDEEYGSSPMKLYKEI